MAGWEPYAAPDAKSSLEHCELDSYMRPAQSRTAHTSDASERVLPWSRAKEPTKNEAGLMCVACGVWPLGALHAALAIRIIIQVGKDQQRLRDRRHASCLGRDGERAAASGLNG